MTTATSCSKRSRVKMAAGGLFCCCLLMSCGGGDEAAKREPLPAQQAKESLQEANKVMLRNEAFEIENYIRRRDWKMQETGTGLRWMVYRNGDGPRVEAGREVTLRGTMELINGLRCYDSESDGLKVFVAGTGEIVSGLQEAVLLLRAGDRARLIVPQHLGYGLSGDGGKVPARATLIYDIEVVSVK